MPRYIVNTERLKKIDPKLKGEIEKLVDSKKIISVELEDLEFEYIEMVCNKSVKYAKMFMKKPEMKAIKSLQEKLRRI